MSKMEQIKEWIPFLTDKDLAELNFLCWCEAVNRGAEKTGQEIEQLVDNALKK